MYCTLYIQYDLPVVVVVARVSCALHTIRLTSLNFLFAPIAWYVWVFVVFCFSSFYFVLALSHILEFYGSLSAVVDRPIGFCNWLSYYERFGFLLLNRSLNCLEIAWRANCDSGHGKEM